MLSVISVFEKKTLGSREAEGPSLRWKGLSGKGSSLGLRSGPREAERSERLKCLSYRQKNKSLSIV